MPNDNSNSNGSHQSDNYQNAQSSNYQNIQNGIAQSLDPMGDGAEGNPFNIIDRKNGIDPYGRPVQHAPTNPQGMPPGTESFQASTAPNQFAPNTEGASPMDKWFKPLDNGGQQLGTPQPQPTATPAATPEVPPEFQSVFAASKIDEYQKLLANRDFAGSLVTPEIMEAFKDGDFSALAGIINGAVQQGSALSSFMSSRVADKGVQGMLDNFQNATLPNLLNEHQSKAMWKSPEFSDFNTPEMQPMVNMAMNHIKSQFPQASPQEQQTHALSMLQDMSKHMGGLQFNGNSANPAPVETPPEVSDMERLFNNGQS